MTGQPQSSDVTRRGFMKTTAAVSGAAILAASGSVNNAWAAGGDTIRVGLIGCGGRGTGAAVDCISADPGVKITAIGDAMQDRVSSCREKLAKHAEKVDLPDDRCFTGLDAYQKVIGSGVDLVILTTPPTFRPIHLKAAIEAGKHVFAEKPVAVDAPGVRSVIASAQLAKEKNLAIVAGTQRRHDEGYREVIKRIHDGAIGDVVGGFGYWNQGGLWMHPRKPEWSDLEWQIRNWLYFTWLSGDHIVEQHVHQIDVMCWVMKGPPTSAYSLGGRQVRTDPAYGHIFDHFATEYEWANGTKMLSMCRQIDGTDARVSEDFVGTKGRSNAANTIRGENPFRYKAGDDKRSPYRQEHVNLIESIRAGKPINEGKQVAESTMTAIMGRMSAYSGKLVKWEDAIKSEQSLMPAKLDFSTSMPVAPVAMPGKTQVI